MCVVIFNLVDFKLFNLILHFNFIYFQESERVGPARERASGSISGREQVPQVPFPHRNHQAGFHYLLPDPEE